MSYWLPKWTSLRTTLRSRLLIRRINARETFDLPFACLPRARQARICKVCVCLGITNLEFRVSTLHIKRVPIWRISKSPLCQATPSHGGQPASCRQKYFKKNWKELRYLYNPFGSRLSTADRGASTKTSMKGSEAFLCTCHSRRFGVCPARRRRNGIYKFPMQFNFISAAGKLQFLS